MTKTGNNLRLTDAVCMPFCHGESSVSVEHTKLTFTYHRLHENSFYK